MNALHFLYQKKYGMAKEKFDLFSVFENNLSSKCYQKMADLYWGFTLKFKIGKTVCPPLCLKN